MAKKTTDKQLVEYSRRMQEIVSRTMAIRAIRAGAEGLPYIIVVEIIYLQLRQILELIATALLVVNKDAVTKLREPGLRSWHALDILKGIRSVNPDFYPKATKDGEKDRQGVIPIEDKQGDILTLEKFITLYNRCGRITHTQNPFDTRKHRAPSTKEDCLKLLDQASRWESRIVRLLTHHTFKLRDDETLYVAHTVGEPPVFHVTEFAPVSP